MTPLSIRLPVMLWFRVKVVHVSTGGSRGAAEKNYRGSIELLSLRVRLTALIRLRLPKSIPGAINTPSS